MSMNYRQEFDRLRDAFRNKERRRQNVEIAVVRDTSMHESFGYVLATLVDGTPINIQAWTTTNIPVGASVVCQPLSGQSWNWYVLLGVNNSVDLETTSYTPPLQIGSSLASHALDSSKHTGTLPWNKVSTAVNKVNLTSDVNGLLPVANQVLQTSRTSLSIAIPIIFSGVTDFGSFTAPQFGFVRKVRILNGTNITLTFHESPGGTVEYQTGNVATPFTDSGGWMHAADAKKFYWTITNEGASTATFLITLDIIGWDT